MNYLAGLLAGLMLMGNTNATPVRSVEVRTDYGIVLNEQGDGKIVVDADDYYNYISYRNVAGAETGDCVKTVSINVNGECEYRYDTIVETCIDRYEGDDINEYCIFEIWDNNNIVMGECYAWEYVDAVNADDYSDMHKLWDIGGDR